MVHTDVSGCAMRISDYQIVQLDRLIQSPIISSTSVSGFMVSQNSTTKGVDVSFSLASNTGVSGITLLRNFSMDPATATALQSWLPNQTKYVWSDTDQSLQSHAKAFYWLILSPQGTTGESAQIGPQSVALNQQTASPATPSAISASHGVPVSGQITVTVNVSFSSPSVKIYIAPYQGNPQFLAISQGSAPLQFALNATGELTTIKAVGVSAGGAESAVGATTTLLLNSTATVPATIQSLTASHVTSGNQVSWPSSKDAGPAYKIYKALNGQPFSSATLLTTVTSTAGTVVFLDVGESAGKEYFVVATNSVGDSLPSAPATT